MNFGETPYFSASRMAEEHEIRIYNRKETGKFVFYFPANQVKITANSSFIMIGRQMVHMVAPAIQAGEEIFVPVHSFSKILKDNIYSALQYSYAADDSALVFAIPGHLQTSQTVTGSSEGVYLQSIDFEEKKNGTTIILQTNGNFGEDDFSSFFKDNNYFYFTIYKCRAEERRINDQNPTRSISSVKAYSNENSTQLVFHLTKNFNSADIFFNPGTRQIVISLFLPLNEEIKEKISSAKETWTIDTIVLDPGHGGMDPGTPSRWKNMMHEKDIVLDVVQRLGKLLEKETDLNVVYTRKTDVAVPLWKRTQIANDAKGKLFISIHVDGVDSKQAHGFSSWLLRPGRSEDAIKVAEKENAVIQMETAEDKKRYENYDNVTAILANLVHSSNMMESEVFAEILSKNVTQKVPQKNRGVKQAGLYVLVGADMPKVLIELGFNSNYEEAKKLNDRRHRQLLAETIFNSIVEFKIHCDKDINQYESD
ncbi:MAG: N-acetylmuramoyl-L-alanine amidase [Candidatus Marinimicrobia bacterium]|nr:N-acetylmuramoyl-L-alanine amidase [Candidatus Neomarinimicrobiota bacterium]